MIILKDGENENQNALLFHILKHGGTVIDTPLKDDGSLDGKAFSGVLAEAIASIPPVWVRLKNDPEWNGKRYYSPNGVVGAMLHGIMQASGTYTKGGTDEQHEDEVPDDLTGLACFLKAKILAWKSLMAQTIFESNLRELGEFIWSRLQEGAWFTEKTCDPEVAVHNGLIILRNAARDFDRFNRDFEERWAKEHPKNDEDN